MSASIPSGGRYLGEAADQRGEPGAPELFLAAGGEDAHGVAAELEVAEALAQRLELDQGVVDGPGAELAGRVEPADLRG